MKKNKYHMMTILKGRTSISQVELHKDCMVFGRPDATTGWTPDVDLSPDCHVSRKHARLIFKNGSWWIEDLKSKYGTRVNGIELHCQIKLLPCIPIQMGETVLVLDHPDQKCRKWNGMTLEYRMIPAVNYALYHCGIPILSDFTLKNSKRGRHRRLTLSISLKGFSDRWEKIVEVPPGDTVTFDQIHLPLHYEKLEGYESTKKANLEIRINNNVVVADDIKILGFYYWPTDPAFRKTLACFVQAAHPMVQNIVLDANAYLELPEFTHSLNKLLKSDRPDKVDMALMALYDCIRDRYDIEYQNPPRSVESGYQELRPPHMVISDTRYMRGKGTCIDIVLMFASCLENLFLQPLIIVVKESGHSQHALLGCWRIITERFEPVITDRENFIAAVADTHRKKLIVLETTGVTRRYGDKLEFEESIAKAEKQLLTKEFLYALDITVLRQTVPSLQLPMSPKATEIIRHAEEISLGEQTGKLETKHLLYSLFHHRERINDVLIAAKVDFERFDSDKMFSMPTPKYEGVIIPRPTINYRRAIEDARLTASDTGLGNVDELHLWYAVLLSRSENIEYILRKLGTTREKLKRIFDHYHPWTGDVVQTVFEIIESNGL